jgi:hypothetical protein
MGKKEKEHRKKVAKRNANIMQQQQKMKKLWQDAFQEQMEAMKEKFENEKNIDQINEKLDSLEETINGLDDEKINELQLKIKDLSEMLGEDSEVQETGVVMENTELENAKKTNTQEESKSTEHISGNETI